MAEGHEGVARWSSADGPWTKAEAQVWGAIGYHGGTNTAMRRSDRRPGPDVKLR
jgi:hypothetical protein